ncbi:hypothetical protein Pcinc_004379 [Petrolisthes cinctipes]|uniref:Secreted protein n=1 Tax=Petrolisthes cinctipes TaxID=88211 RepID=A0AAE1GET2_PETCI|nr:hypothetical protein Pcinc_016182 [Petrolisthes cinctipes]KAK3891734.1 hypothetical protein Pcinc_004379 [Petrolisthes cinctipes]
MFGSTRALFLKLFLCLPSSSASIGWLGDDLKRAPGGLYIPAKNGCFCWSNSSSVDPSPHHVWAHMSVYLDSLPHTLPPTPNPSQEILSSPRTERGPCHPR